MRTFLRSAGRGLALAAALVSSLAAAQSSPPPSTAGFFPLSQVKAGLKGTAWTVYKGTKPEPMDVEILGILRGARGPGHDMILAQLHGTHPEYTGVVEGMSGSPVYIDGKLVGALAYRIGQFTRDPIAGITPIEQMLEVRNLPVSSAGTQPPAKTGETNFQMMETPLVMSGFSPQAVRFWQEKMAGTGLENVAAGGMGTSSADSDAPSAKAAATIEPGSAVSAQLVRGDVEVSATCTVTYVDPKQLLACGHPILQAGTVSLPMTTAEVVTTLASPLNSFKIVNTGAVIGAFTEDRDAAIRGVLGARARMIPMHIAVDGQDGKRKVNVEILDLPSLTPQAMAVVLYQALLQSNDNTATTTYHVTGGIEFDGGMSSPVDIWAAPGEAMPAPMAAALEAGQQFLALYSNAGRQAAVRAIEIHVAAIPRRMGVELESARLVSDDTVHAGGQVVVEATVRPWQQPTRNVRISVKLPARLNAGGVRMLVSDAGTLDRTLNQPRLPGKQPGFDSVLAQFRNLHTDDRIYVSLLTPETQASVAGQTLTGLPLSMANALEPMRSSQEAGLNGESAVVMGEAPAGGVLSGFQILTLHIVPGGGLN